MFSVFHNKTNLSCYKPLFLLSGWLFLAGTGHSQIINEDFWVTNGPVYSLVKNETTLFLGGKFSYVGKPTGSGLITDFSQGSLVQDNPLVNGTVRCAVPDGTGGWYLAGDFTQVGGLPRNRIVHLLPDNSVDPAWNPDANGTVYALLISGTELIIGGSFTTLGGQTRNYLGSVDLATGIVTSWTPSPSSSVFALAQNSVHLFAGGSFTTVSGEARTYLVSFDKTTKGLTTWRPTPNNRVRCLLNPYNDDNYLLVGGEFTTFAGQNRSYLTMVYSTSDLNTSWFAPAANNSVYSLCAGPPGTVFAGGYFTSIGGQTRNYVAKLQLYNGLSTSWNALITSGYVLSLTTSGSQVYVGGSFGYAGSPSVSRNNAAAFDLTSAAVSSWNPNPFGLVLALGTSGSQVYLGGSFSGAYGVARNNLAAFDLLTGEATAWNPDASYSVNSLALSGDQVLIGGSFTFLGGQSRKYIGSVSAQTGALSTWNPSANGLVRCIYPGLNVILVGGDFTTLGGIARNKLAAIDPATEAVTAWDPNVNGSVYTLVSDGVSIFAGGSFSAVGGTTRNGLAEINLEGTVTAWNPSVTTGRSVFSMILRGDLIYAGGNFTTVGSQIRNRLAAINKTSGIPDSWNPNANSDVKCLFSGSSVIFAGGAFSRINNVTQQRLAGLNPSTGAVVSWVPGTNDVVYALEAIGSGLYAGGDFTQLGSEAKSFFGLVYDENTLPVKLTEFTATVSFPTVHLRWETASELNNSGFELQVRHGSESWQSAGWIAGRGTTTQPTRYSFTHTPDWNHRKTGYRLIQRDLDGHETASDVVTVFTPESEFTLSPAYPNPFNPETTVQFSLSRPGRVKLTLSDLTGRELKVLLDGQQPAGSQSLHVSANGLSSGVYFIRLEAGTRQKLQKIVILK